MTQQASVQAHKKSQFKVLLIAGLTEFGERYSYYIIQSLLILFLVYHFKLQQNISAALVGTILSMIYISSIVGGFIADNLLGHYRAAFVGTILMTCSSIILSISHTLDGLYLGLACIAISSGLIKSNISSFIGHYYDKTRLPHSQRDFGFSIFYVCINLGAFFAQFVAAYLANQFGYNAAFYSSIIINLAMIANLCLGYQKLKIYINDRKITLSCAIQAALAIIGYIAVVLVTLHYRAMANLAIIIAALLCVLILVRAARHTARHNHPLIAMVFFILSIIYWALYFQLFISIELFIKNAVNHHFLFLNINTTQFLSIESLFILIFGFFTGKIWVKLDQRGRNVQDIDKFNIAFFFMLMMFALFYVACMLTASTQKIPALVIIAGFLLLALSELCLSAIGLSLMTKIAPKQFVALYMGIWLVTLGIGGKIAGLIAQYIPIAQQVASAKHAMQHGFILFMLLCAAAIIICLASRSTIIRRCK